MAAALNRQAFFASVRKAPFGGSLAQSQVDGLNALLDMAPPAMGTNLLAYCLATTHHETGGAMVPRVENLNYTTASRICQVWPNRFPTIASAEPYVRNPEGLANKVYGGRLGNKLPTDGWDFRGMGDVQATGRDNARRATGRLQDLGYLKSEQDLEKTPTLMLEPDIAAAMLFVGLSEGWYTGKKLSDFFTDTKAVPVAARAMVNPDTNGATVAALYRGYVAALEAAGHIRNGVAASVPVPPVTTAPLAPLPSKPAPGYSGALEPVKVESKPSIWNRVVGRITGMFAG
jgi:putative chitinase